MHPFVKIACFFFLLLLLQYLSPSSIAVLCGLICLLAAVLNLPHFSQLIKRMRWLFLSLLLVYAYATPGEYLAFLPLNVAPSYEGLHLGLMQIAKLLIAVASLSALFASASKSQLMAGLWTLLSPLRLVGLNVERFTVRMLLTLHYVEQMAVQAKLKLDFSQLDKLALAPDEPGVTLPLILAQPAFTWFDKAMLSLMLLAVMGLSFSKFVGAVDFFKVWQA
ncbi:MAG: energy-coupling factor transporter transmembrane protein EcfT [Candidatus Methylopumilus sp.]|nr:energy-coupling factor transporter transmembrane protein EcfT [Candidatus Methylopumilus sp.]